MKVAHTQKVEDCVALKHLSQGAKDANIDEIVGDIKKLKSTVLLC